MDESLSDVIAAFRDAKTTWLLLESLPESINAALQERLATAHRLDGAAVTDGEMAVLGFRLPQESRFILHLSEEEIKFFPYAWCVGFGAAISRRGSLRD